MDIIKLRANAKINLTLDIVGRREDGYHLLETVMQSISLHDDIILTKLKEKRIEIICDDPDVPCDERNIAWKAAALFLDKYKINDGVKIEIEKRNPSQAGLGGGSADGAAVLEGMNRLFDINCSEDELCELGLKVGADVPFCIVGGTKMCRGIGEVISDADAMPECIILICKPDVNISTAKAYSEIDKGNVNISVDNDGMMNALKEKSINEISSRLSNIFDAAMSDEKVQSVKLDMIKFGALGASMSGSGSAVFGIFDDEQKAEGCRRLLLNTYKETYICCPARSGTEIM